MKTTNRLIQVAAALALTTSMAGMAAAQELRMTIWSANEAHLALFNGIADSFTAERPGVSVSFESLPFASYTTTLTTQIAGGNPPDLAWILERTASDFVNSGILAPLNDAFTNAEGFDYDDMITRPTELWRLDGELYAVPFSTSPLAIFANTDLIEAAGGQTPAQMIEAGEWTWENVMQVAASVAEGEKDGLIVRDFNYQTWQNLAAIWRGWGAAPWSADGDTCTFADPEMVDAMTFIYNAAFETGAIPGPGESVDFFAGDAAMTITQISRASLLPKGDDAFNWDLVPLPAGPVGNYSVIGQAAIGVFKDSANSELAVEFLTHMTSPENSAKLAQFFPPIRASLLNADTLGSTNPLLNAAMIESVVVQGIANGQVLPVHEGYSEIQQLVRAELDALWLPDANVADVLGSVCQRIQPLL